MRMGRSSPFVSLAEDQRERLKRKGDQPPVPFFLVTGFLGAGKTTLINRVLAAPQGKRIAILVNDVGQINVDRQLLSGRAGDLIELTGGCVCCQVDLQRDLFGGVDDLVERAQPDAVVLETTGIADPRVLLAAFDAVDESGELRHGSAVPMGVTCVVDAELGVAGEARSEWRAQIEAADRIVLTKIERASPESLRALHARLVELAPHAERAAFPEGAERAEASQALARFLLAKKTQRRLDASPTHAHSQLSVSTFLSDAPLLEAPFTELLATLVDQLVRLKGWAQLHSDAGLRWAYVERAGARLTIETCDPPPHQTRSELVFILDPGPVDEEVLRRRLWACRAGA
jgi:G3E family GTPase